MKTKAILTAEDCEQIQAAAHAEAVQGGVPIMHGEHCVGAVGVSGAQSDEDEQIALAGIAALGLKVEP